MPQVAEFKIDIPDADLADLRERLARTRWPDAETSGDRQSLDWNQGVPLAYAKELAEYWLNGYDWRAREAYYNGFPQYVTEIDDLSVHFIHRPSPHADAEPLLITHGWPGSVVEFHKVIGPLADPAAHGGDAEDAFHVVCPSLPGYGFSGKPTNTGWGVGKIAEAWDAGGLYQVGSFPAYGRWAEWNGRYRDDIRRFVKGDGGMLGAMAARIQGSPDIYGDRGPRASVNFVTAHDGFTMRDLVSYNHKHNEANGEDNRDGMNENFSWNCGAEGETEDEAIKGLRERQIKNFLSLLLVSQGVPMLLMGDEIGHSKGGNNNSYCHDSEVNWFNWDETRTQADLLRFTRRLIAFRKAHPALRRRAYFHHRDTVNSGYPDISFHGRELWQPDWSYDGRQLACLLCGEHCREGAEADDMIYIIMNAHWETAWFDLPPLGAGRKWRVAINTGLRPPEDSHALGQEPVLPNQGQILVGPRSVLILVGT